MKLLLKCAAADVMMAGIHFISGTPDYYIAGLMLSFPGLSMLAYYFLYREQGAEKVYATTSFAILSIVPFALFLIVLHLLVKGRGIGVSLAAAGAVWLAAALAAVALWNCMGH